MNLIEYPDREMMMIDLANRLAGDLTMALTQHETASIAVPGGTTPGPIFDALCAADLDWARVRVMLSDERWVPETSDRSNTRLLRERLLVNRAAAATLVPLYADADTPEEKLGELTAGLEPNLPLSVLLLGMGADMHTASLFPGADKLKQALAADAPALVPMRAPGAPEARITLSARVLDASEYKHIVIMGDEKRAALEQAQTLTSAAAPVCAILNDTKMHWAP